MIQAWKIRCRQTQRVQSRALLCGVLGKASKEAASKPWVAFILRAFKTPIQKNLCTPVFTAAQFTIAKCWKQPKCPSVNEWIKKNWYIYTMEFYATERKKELLPFGMDGTHPMDGSGEHYAK